MIRGETRELRRTTSGRAAVAMLIVTWLCRAMAAAQGEKDAVMAQNSLTEAEKSAGWKLLFDGKTTTGWHNFNSDKVAEGWKVIDGCLTMTGNGGDIVTEGEYENFELSLEWAISEGGNSGIFFHVVESPKYKYVWETGPEMQVLDNAKHNDGKNALTSAGSNYALHAPAKDVTKPVGEFNEVRIVVKKGNVQHWLNGEKIVEYQIGSPEWKELVEGSKFKQMPDYAKSGKGRIALQDHGDRVRYRNIKIRPL